MITKEGLPFPHDWEKVVTPVVDFAVNLPEVDSNRMAVIDYSMGGYLVPRALAFGASAGALSTVACTAFLTEP